jgi:hypothetical protein
MGVKCLPQLHSNGPMLSSDRGGHRDTRAHRQEGDRLSLLQENRFKMNTMISLPKFNSLEVLDALNKGA